MSFDTQYRPETFDEIVGQPVDEIAAMLNGQYTPNYLFYGPPATGKTTTARAIAREMYGNLQSFYEINASDERGVDTIRDRIGKWARQDVGTQATLTMDVPIILLDEMDGLTTEAQHALRSPMEDSSAVFILTANAIDNVHAALKSRCETYEFGPVPAAKIQQRLEEVARMEAIEMDPQKIQDIAVESNGDMRTALRRLEREHRLSEKRTAEQADKVAQYIGDN
jgi:replication factor C small subunit